MALFYYYDQIPFVVVVFFTFIYTFLNLEIPGRSSFYGDSRSNFAGACQINMTESHDRLAKV